MLLLRLLRSVRGPTARDARRFLSTANPTVDDMHAAASRIASAEFARAILEEGERELASGYVRKFVPALTLVAGHRLGCVDQILPGYERFLAMCDSCERADWHVDVSAPRPGNNLLELSGRLAQPEEEFQHEFERVRSRLGPPEQGTVLDVGCGGGLWAIRLGQLGYRVVGTDHHAKLIEAAIAGAKDAGVGDRVSFRVDDATNSTLPDGFVSRAICIGVTPTLGGERAFAALVEHLARVTRSTPSDSSRRTILLGSNRWRPSRMAAVKGLLDNAGSDHVLTFQNLCVLEICFWLSPAHLATLTKRFDHVHAIEWAMKGSDGKRVDFLLR